MPYELLFSLVFSLVFSIAPVVFFSRAALAASGSGGTSGNQDAPRSTEPPVPAGTGGAVKTRGTTKPKDAADIDWHLFLLDDETIAALERELDAYVWPPDAPDAIPPTDH